MSNNESQRLNRYTCQKCGGSIVTVDRDEGVTPMFLGCRATTGCKGTMASAMYRGVTGTPDFEWRKPTSHEYRKMSEPMRRHIDDGGLNLYLVKDGKA